MREETTNAFQQAIIDRLTETQAYTDEDKGYERYQRREHFEKFLYDEYGLEFCGCGDSEFILQAIFSALVVASQPSPTWRARALLSEFGVKQVNDNPLAQFLFRILTAKGFMDHADEASLDDSVLTPAGAVFLPLLKKYLGE